MINPATITPTGKNISIASIDNTSNTSNTSNTNNARYVSVENNILSVSQV